MILSAMLMSLAVHAAEPVADTSGAAAEATAEALVAEALEEKPKSAEEQIAVHLDPPSKSTSGGESPWLRFSMGVGVVGLLGVGGYLLTGRYRRAQIGKTTAPEIKVLRQHYLGPKKSLAIIRVAGESILIGVTDHNINLIKSLALLDDDIPETVGVQNFEHSLDNAKETSFKVTSPPQQDAESEEYSISGIREFVSQRLKNMRSIN